VMTSSCNDAKGFATMAVYSATKAAVRSLVRTLAVELADRGNLGSLRGAGYQSIINAIRDVADALQYVHAQGLTHGDLKAGNVLRDAQGRWRLTDFRSGDSPAATAAVSLSTVSPQQLAGAPPTVGTRAVSRRSAESKASWPRARRRLRAGDRPDTTGARRGPLVPCAGRETPA